MFVIGETADIQLAKEREKEAKLEAKKAADAKKKLDAELFKTAQVQQKVPFGTGKSAEPLHRMHGFMLTIRSEDRTLSPPLSREGQTNA